MIRKYLTLVCFAGMLICISLTTAFAQNDTTTTVVTQSRQTEKQIVIRKRYNPRKAMLMSAALPGLGQAYTKKYWKIPIIYTGAAVLGYFIVENNRNYILWRDRYIIQRTATESGLAPPLENPVTEVPYTLATLKLRKDYYRRNRDFSVILSGVLYVLNLVDANVTAHLKDFDLSEDLSMSVQPSFFYQPGAMQPATGITLTLNFK